MRQKFIFVCHPDNLILAQRAAKWLLERPAQDDAVIAYGEGLAETTFYIMLIRLTHTNPRASVSSLGKPAR